MAADPRRRAPARVRAQRAPQRWFDVVVWPVVDAVLFGAIGVYFGEQQGTGRCERRRSCSPASSSSTSCSRPRSAWRPGFMEETWSRNLLNLMVTPLREVEYVAGVVLFGLAKLALGVSVVGARGVRAVRVRRSPTSASRWSRSSRILLLVGWAVGADRDRADPARRAGRRDPGVGPARDAACRCRASSIRSSALPGILQPIGQVLPADPRVRGRPQVLDGDRCRGTSSASPPSARVVLAVGVGVVRACACSRRSAAAATSAATCRHAGVSRAAPGSTTSARGRARRSHERRDHLRPCASKPSPSGLAHAVPGVDALDDDRELVAARTRRRSRGRRRRARSRSAYELDDLVVVEEAGVFADRLDRCAMIWRLGLAPVEEEEPDVGERVAERRHLPVEDGHDPPGSSAASIVLSSR